MKTWQAQETAEFSLETFRRWVVCFQEMAPNLLRKARKLLAEMKPGWKYEKDRRLFKTTVPDVKAELYQLFVLREYFNYLVAEEDYFPWLIFLRSTRFGADGKGLTRDNAPCLTGRQARAGPKRRCKIKSPAGKLNGGKKNDSR